MDSRLSDYMKLFRRIRGYFNKRQRVPVPEFPQSIILEPTNSCNLRCRMCPVYGEGVTKKREVGFIKKETWTNLIDELGSWPSQVNLDVHGAGEPLLHPNFFEIINYSKSKNNINVGFLCNATLLDQQKAKAVKELGVDWVCFSVDGAQKDIFEYYRKGALLEVVEENIRFLLSLRNNGKPRISFNMVNHPDADINQFIDKWAGLVDSLIISLKRPVRREENKRVRLLKPCPLLYQQLVIGWPGKTGLCCEDLWGDYITGEFPFQSLYEIWHGKPLNRARKLHEFLRQDRLSLCKTCDTTIFHCYKAMTVEKYGRKTVVSRESTELNPEIALPEK